MWVHWSATNPDPCQYFGKFSSTRELRRARFHRNLTPAFHLMQTEVVGKEKASLHLFSIIDTRPNGE